MWMTRLVSCSVIMTPFSPTSSTRTPCGRFITETGTRPVNPLAARMAVLAGLTAVDWVVAFDEDTPEQLLLQLQPHVLVKGGDYRLDEVVGADLMRAWQGDVRVLAKHDSCSTTGLVARLRTDAEPAAGMAAAREQEG